jgi:hypothetical protein
MAEFLLLNYVKHLPGMSREEIGRVLAECNRERLEAVPSLTKYPELRGTRQLVEAQWRGTREGTGLDDVLVSCPRTNMK